MLVRVRVLPGRAGLGPMGRRGAQQPVRTGRHRATRPGRQHRPGPMGTRQSPAGRPAVGRSRRNPPPTGRIVGGQADGRHQPAIREPARVVPIAVGRLAARGPETLSGPRRSGRPEMVRARDRPAEPPAVGKRRRAGVCQQVWRRCPDGPRRDVAGIGRLRRGTLVLGADPAGEHVAGGSAVRTWPGYPDTDLDLAAVRARLVLVSILEGAADRARAELAEFTRLHPDARGRLGGQEGQYAASVDKRCWTKASSGLLPRPIRTGPRLRAIPSGTRSRPNWSMSAPWRGARGCVPRLPRPAAPWNRQPSAKTRTSR